MFYSLRSSPSADPSLLHRGGTMYAEIHARCSLFKFIVLF